MGNDFRVRAFTPDDYPMICEWSYGHRQGRLRAEEGWRTPPLEMLPQVSVIVYQLDPMIDLAACWLYMARDCPVCVIDHAVTRPGLHLVTARNALLHCMQYFKFFAARQGYLIMNAYAGRALGRTLERMGWFKGEGELTQYSSALFEVPDFMAPIPQEAS